MMMMMMMMMMMIENIYRNRQKLNKSVYTCNIFLNIFL